MNAVTVIPQQQGTAIALSSGCMPFLGNRRRSGYGYAQFMGRQYLAHRLAFALNECCHPGALSGVVIRHKCDNPSCINVEHLEAGTQQDNANDMVQRGRSLRGERGTATKLTAAQVAEIRATYAPRSKHANQYQLARRFGVGQPAVSLILSGKNWSH